MSVQCEVTAKQAAGAPMSVFERYLSVWVAFAQRVSGHWSHGGGPGQPAGGRADLGDDHPDAAESGLFCAG